MNDDPCRRRLMQLSLAILPALAALGEAGGALADDAPHVAGQGPERDFDAFFGSWTVRHRRLKTRLAGANDWEAYDGATSWRSLLGGVANCNDSITHRGGTSYRTLGLRACDPQTGAWADWSLDARDPLKIDAAGIGRFSDGVGLFLSDDTLDGRPIKVRGQFSSISPDVNQWDQAFSADDGRTWETNYVMRYIRTA